MSESLWKRTIALAHESIKACHPCQLVGPRSTTEPIRTTNPPEGPWTDITVDLLEIPGGNHPLVVVDNYSRWPDAILLKKTDAAHVTRAMEGMFQTRGLALSVRSDNWFPFSSAQFEGFPEYLGVEHEKGIPYWPQSNGKVERSNHTLLKMIRIAN